MGDVERIDSPKKHFDSNLEDLYQVVEVVRNGFGRELEFEDIYKHITSPERVYLLRYGNIKAMASYNTRRFNGISSLIVEGIALSPEVQGKGIFSLLTKDALHSEELVCLRTQNPRMYRALEKFCKETYPSKRETPEKIKLALEEFAEYTNSKPNEFGVVKGYYGGLFYGKEPTHCEITRFFKEDLKMNLSEGDAVLAIGTIS